MSTTTTKTEDKKQNPENPTAAFASLQADVERLSGELQTLQKKFTENIQQSLSEVSTSVENQLKEAATTAEQAVRKKLVSELREKFGKELELAMTERDLIARRLQSSTK